MEKTDFDDVRRQVREMAMTALKGRGQREMQKQKLKERGSLVC
jgi:hypothetical protein